MFAEYTDKFHLEDRHGSLGLPHSWPVDEIDRIGCLVRLDVPSVVLVINVWARYIFLKHFIENLLRNNSKCAEDSL